MKNVTTCSFRGVAKIIYNESFKENGMSCAVNWFRRVDLQKQPPEAKKGVPKNPAKFIGKHLC